MSSDEVNKRFGHAFTEASNRAEATALLIRCGYRVYRPEADIDGEDMVVRTSDGEFRAVQLKSRPIIWMLFPSAPFDPKIRRAWFLIPHDIFYEWVANRHGSAPAWNEYWSYPSISKSLRELLNTFELKTSAEANQKGELPD